MKQRFFSLFKKCKNKENKENVEVKINVMTTKKEKGKLSRSSLRSFNAK